MSKALSIVYLSITTNCNKKHYARVGIMLERELSNNHSPLVLIFIQVGITEGDSSSSIQLNMNKLTTVKASD